MNTLILVGLLFFAAYLFLKRKRIPKGLRPPPGPPSKFLIGNLLDLPTQKEWQTYSQWSKTYGELVYVNVLGMSLAIVNSSEMAYELFDKRSMIYSDRPVLPMLSELMAFDTTIPAMQYGERWRRHRQMFHKEFSATASVQFNPAQLQYARNILRRFRTSPRDFIDHIRYATGALIFKAVYGIQPLEKNDPYLSLVESAIATASRAGAPGAFLVDVLPILKHVPEWVPGAGFKKKAREWRKLILDMSGVPFQAVKDMISAGHPAPSMTLSMLEELESKENALADEEEIIRNVAGTSYAAGADTTACALEIFFLAILHFPEAQAAAQAELDRVIGPDRLPTFEDRENLPYLKALCYEVLRWHPVTPLVFPHRLTTDDVVGEYFLPEGTLVCGNAWQMFHSEATYGPEPEKFNPERFLVNGGAKDSDASFGWGRRMCPGRYMAEDSLFIFIANILHVYNIIPILGAPLPAKDGFVAGVISRPLPFNCDIRPRSASAEALIDALDDAL